MVASAGHDREKRQIEFIQQLLNGTAGGLELYEDVGRMLEGLGGPVDMLIVDVEVDEEISRIPGRSRDVRPGGQ
jgi:hypothetical protein